MIGRGASSRGSRHLRRATLRRLAGVSLTGIMLAVGIAGCSRRSPESHEVPIRNFVFEPATLTVAQGDTIIWSNQDFVAHTATAHDGAWDSGSVPAGDTWQLVAVTPGRHAYYCVFHPNMEGTIEVQ